MHHGNDKIWQKNKSLIVQGNDDSDVHNDDFYDFLIKERNDIKKVNS